MDESRQSIQASRLMAQVHEELMKTVGRVDQIQEQNSKRLEEISKLDTEITGLYARCAVSEQRLAETFEQTRQAEQLREQQKATDEAKLSKLRESLLEKQEALQQVVIPEVKHIEAKTDAKARLSEMRALESKESAQKSLAETARQRMENLNDEIYRERQRHQDLHRALRKAAEDRQSTLENQKALKVAIQQKGADPSADAGEVEKEAEIETQQIRSELASIEEKCQQLRKKLKDVAKHGDEEVDKLELTLQNARDDLERSFTQAADVQRAEVTTIENKVKAERQRLNIETASRNTCRERIEELRQSLLKAKTAPSLPSSPVGSPVSTLLTDEIRRIQQQAITVEQQLQERSAELIGLKQQQMDVKVQADDEALQVKAKIQEIWQSLALSAMAG